MSVKSEWHIQKAKPYFSTKSVSVCSMGCMMREGVRRNALRVLCPKSSHSEESAQHIEWRDPTGAPTNFVNWWGVELRSRSRLAIG